MNIIEVERKITGEIKWDLIREELKKYSGLSYIVEETKETIIIDKKFIKEFTNSESTKFAKKTIKRLKVNLIDHLQEIIEKSTSKTHEENKEEKHKKDASEGWDKYDIGFNYHTIDDKSNERILEYQGMVVIRCVDDKKYLYDVINIKKRGM